jgi:hypothetical protein
MRRSTLYIFFTLFNLGFFALMLLHLRHGQASAQAELLTRARMVKELRLTDLCLFTEARYTRNPAMADLFSALQDHPFALEHFPSGSLVSPPGFVSRRHEQYP